MLWCTICFTVVMFIVTWNLKFVHMGVTNFMVQVTNVQVKGGLFSPYNSACLKSIARVHPNGKQVG